MRKSEALFDRPFFRKLSISAWNWLIAARFWGRPDYCLDRKSEFRELGLWIRFRLTPLEMQHLPNVEQPTCRRPKPHSWKGETQKFFNGTARAKRSHRSRKLRS